MIIMLERRKNVRIWYNKDNIKMICIINLSYSRSIWLKNKLELFIENWSYSYDKWMFFATYYRMRAKGSSWAGTSHMGNKYTMVQDSYLWTLPNMQSLLSNWYHSGINNSRLPYSGLAFPQERANDKGVSLTNNNVDDVGAVKVSKWIYLVLNVTIETITYTTPGTDLIGHRRKVRTTWPLGPLMTRTLWTLASQRPCWPPWTLTTTKRHMVDTPSSSPVLLKIMMPFFLYYPQVLPWGRPSSPLTRRIWKCQKFQSIQPLHTIWYIRIDNQLMVEVFRNSSVLHNIFQDGRTLHLICNDGTVPITLVRNIEGYSTVWYHPKSIFNIL